MIKSPRCEPRALCSNLSLIHIYTARLEQILVRFSQLVVEQRWIKEIDINPLLASADGLLALDAREMCIRDRF